PRYSWEDLAEAAATREVWALSGCHAGAVPAAAARGDLAGPLAAAVELRDLVGTRLHRERWHHGLPGGAARNDLLWEAAQHPGAVARAGELGERLAFDLGLVAPRLPDFPMPGHFRSEMEYLRHLTFEGARSVYPGEGEGGIEPGARRRLEHELAVIDRLGFP